MKKKPPRAFDAEVWKEIERIFWTENLECLPRGTSYEGIDPEAIFSMKRGVEVHGGIWFLLGPPYKLNLCLIRPRFSSIESVTVKKLRTARILESWLEDDLLSVDIG